MLYGTVSDILYGTVRFIITANVNRDSSVKYSSSSSSNSSGSTDTSRYAKGSDSQQRMLASQCNNGGSIQPCVGLR